MILLKKTAILFLTLLILSAGCFFNISFATEDNEYIEARDTLQAIGILNSSYDEMGESVSRMDFLRLCVKAYSLSNDTAKDDFEFIDYARKLKIISADGDVRENDPITYPEAIAMALRTIGYDDSIISKSGGYPDGYISTAANIGLSDGLERLYGEASKRDIAVLAYNMINTPMMIKDEKVTTAKGGETLLSKRHIYSVEGKLTANPITSLTGIDGVGDNKFVVEDSGKNKYICEMDNIDDFMEYIGYKVKILYKQENDVCSVLRLGIANNLDVLEIDGDDIDEFDTATRSMRYTAGNTKKLNKLSIPKDISVIYNFKFSEDNEEVYDLIKKSISHVGNLNIDKIKFIDYNNDSKYDTMYVEMYQNYIFSGMIEDGYIADKYTGSNFNSDGGKNTVKIHNQEGKKMSFSELEDKNVLSVKESLGEEKFINITVLTDNFSGVVTSKSDKKSVEVGSKSYDIANSSVQSKLIESVKCGLRYTYYTDIKGKVAYLEPDNSNLQVGYVTNSYYNAGEGNVYFTIYTYEDYEEPVEKSSEEDGGETNVEEVKISKRVRKLDLKGAQRMKVNSASINISSYNFKPLEFNLVSYKTDKNGDLKEINAASSERKANTLSFTRLETGKDRSDAMVCADDLSMLCSSFKDLCINYDENTVILFVPFDKQAMDNCGDNITVGTRNDLKLYHYYYADGFSLEDKALASDVMCVYYDEITPASGLDRADTYIVGDIYTELSDSEEDVAAFEGYPLSGDLKNYMPEKVRMNSMNIYDYDTGNPITLNSGDIIRVFRNSHGDGMYVSKLYDYETNGYQKYEYISSRVQAKVTIGIPYDSSGNYIRFIEKSLDASIDNAEVYQAIEAKNVEGTVKTYVYDISSGRTEIRQATVGDIKTYLSYGGDCSNVFIYSTNRTPNRIVIYNK